MALSVEHVAPLPQGQESKLQREGDEFILARPDFKLTIRASRLRETSSGIAAELTIESDVLGPLHWGGLNFSSTSQREALVKKLERRKWYSYATRREAETHLAQLLNQLHGGGTIAVNTKKRLDQHLEEWLRGHQPNVAPATFKSYRETIRLHLVPALGHFPLVRLSPQAIRDYVAEKLAAGLSGTSVRYHLMLLHEALGQGVADGLLARNPCDLVQAPRKQRKEMRVLDEEHVRLFLGEAKKSSAHYPLYLTALLSGMRQGELLGLRWKDVDLTLGVASIQQTFYRLGGNKKAGERAQMLFKAPKTEKARRQVVLPSVVIEELRVLREKQAEHRRFLGADYQDHGLIFCQANGKPLHAHNIAQRDFRSVLTRAKLPRIRFHDLRHCHATLLLQQGVHPKVVQERLGHTTIGMTLDTYSHVMPGMQEAAAKALEARLIGSLR